MPSRAHMGWWRWYVVLPASVLLASVAVQGIDVFRETPKAKPPHLATEVPAELAGWASRDLPLGTSEFVAKEAEKILNCDEVVNREFARGVQRFSVYVAYWRPGKMPVRMVACHTPDRCWTENGWHCLEMKFKRSVVVGGRTFLPAEWRKFEPPSGGKVTHVLFWHLVDGRAYDYGERFNSIPDPIRWTEDALRQAFVGCSEQYFIRVASTMPLEELEHEPAFSKVMEGLGRLGLDKERAERRRSG